MDKDEIVLNFLKGYHEKVEQLCAAWYKETNILPTKACIMVQTWHENNKVCQRIWIEERKD